MVGSASFGATTSGSFTLLSRLLEESGWSHFSWKGLVDLPVESLDCLLRWLSGQESACQCRRHRRQGLDRWVGKILGSRKWQPTAIFLPGEPHGQLCCRETLAPGHLSSAREASHTTAPHSPEAAGLTLRAQRDPAWPRGGPLRQPSGQGPLGRLVLPAVRSEDLTHGGGSGPRRHSHLRRCSGLEPSRTSRWEAREYSGWRSFFPPHAVAWGWHCPLGPGRTLLASPRCPSVAVNPCPSAGTNHSRRQGRVSPQGGPGTLNLQQSSEASAGLVVSRVRLSATPRSAAR